MGRRTSQDTATNSRRVIDGDIIITRCLPCSHQKLGICNKSWAYITWPVSGPIPPDCPLPRVPEDTDGD